MADDKRQTLDIPNSATFELKDGKLVVGNETDVVLRGNMGFKFQRIFSRKGSVQLIPPEGVELEVGALGQVRRRHGPVRGQQRDQPPLPARDPVAAFTQARHHRATARKQAAEPVVEKVVDRGGLGEGHAAILARRGIVV